MLYWPEKNLSVLAGRKKKRHSENESTAVVEKRTASGPRVTSKNYSLLISPHGGSANVFCQGPYSKYFTLCMIEGLCGNYSTLPQLCGSSLEQCVSTRAQLCSSVT